MENPHLQIPWRMAAALGRMKNPQPGVAELDSLARSRSACKWDWNKMEIDLHSMPVRLKKLSLQVMRGQSTSVTRSMYCCMHAGKKQLP
jgi:hypothetical protein